VTDFRYPRIALSSATNPPDALDYFGVWSCWTHCMLRHHAAGLRRGAGRRSPLVSLAERGRATYSATDRRQAAWVNRLAGGIGRTDLETTTRVLDELCRRLELSEHQSRR
jgi:hypothetical protein